MEENEVSHMDKVNKLIHKPLPYIICVIDEFGLCAGLKRI
jgi:DNA segregation ATPase FtsK/SpoIIIE-like protein